MLTFLVLLNDLFQVLLAVLENQILRRLFVLTARVVNLEHPHNVFAILQFVEDLKLAGNKFTRLLCALDRNFFLRFRIIGFKNVTYIMDQCRKKGLDAIRIQTR